MVGFVASNMNKVTRLKSAANQLQDQLQVYVLSDVIVNANDELNSMQSESLQIVFIK